MKYLNRFSVIAGLLAMASTAMAQDTYLFCDFEKGIPSSFSTYDQDGNEPSVDVKTYGFEKGKAWIPYYIKAEGNNVASSTSWYTPAGQSDDWLVTPAFTVDSEKAVLRWNAIATDKKHSDGYSVYVSTTGNRPEDFSSEPLFTVSSEQSSWTKHEISLSQYQGKQIWVAFVNDSYNKSRLYLDDIYAGVPSDVYVLVNLDYNISYDGEAYISGYVCSESEESIKGYTLGYTADGQSYSESFPDSVLTDGKKIPFTLKQPLNVTDGVTQPYTVWIKTDNTSYSIERDVTPYVQRTVAEECTGMWCAWCVRGIVMMDRMKQKYPDTFIGIAIHNADKLANRYYDSSINSLGSTGFPYVFVNRSYDGDPIDLEQMYALSMKNPSMSRVAVEASMDADHKLNLSSQVTFAENTKGDYKLAFAIIENNIHQPDDAAFGQQNAYANGSQGEMGGYENYGSIIPASDMYYQDVAHCLIDDKFYGIEGSLPASFEAGVSESFTYTSDLSDVTIYNTAETEIVAMLIDEDGKIVNAAKAPVSPTAGISIIETSNDQNSAIYDIYGNRVNSSYKGIVIKNGRKYIQ